MGFQPPSVYFCGVNFLQQWRTWGSIPGRLHQPLPPPAAASNNLFAEMQSFLASGSTSVEACLPWLRQSGLAVDLAGQRRKTNPCEDEIRHGLENGVLVYRCSPKSKAEMRELRRRFHGKPLPLPGGQVSMIDAIWDEYKNGHGRILRLKVDPVPSDALACYLPFHLWGNRWGIYISVPRLLHYAERAFRVCARELIVLGNMESILRCSLFEIFQHEFFHHVVESTATTLEILASAFGTPQPLYHLYRNHAYESVMGCHPHRPLEEALANAYAYDSLASVSRQKLKYRTVEATLYRVLMQQRWKHQSAGYRNAGEYASVGKDSHAYVSGAAQLTAMLLNSAGVNVPALGLVAKRVMPRGQTAFCQKASVPTYLVGPQPALGFLLANIPAPHEACTALFWHRTTTEIDKGLREHWEHEKRRKVSGIQVA